jgi:UDP-2,3-diacylglucosamine pyrophosphatase LpxH
MFLRAENRGFNGLSLETESKWDGTFEFILLGDPQIGFDDQKKEEEFTELTVKFINDRFKYQRIKFVVVCGDHTHNFEQIWDKKETLEINRKKRKVQLAVYKKIWRRLNPALPLVCVCGNHDVGNSPTAQTIKLYTDEFGDDYVAFYVGGTKFVTLNSQLVQYPEDSGDLAEKQEVWFRNELKDETRKIVFSHIPPFCWNPDEADSNFNWPQERRKKWLDIMVGAGVQNMYCAHYHRRAGGMYKDQLKVTITRAIGTSIFTKDVPNEIKGNKVEEASFKVHRQAFGGLGAVEEESGLYIVTVNKNELSEQWMSISDINKRMRGIVPPPAVQNSLS